MPRWGQRPAARWWRRCLGTSVISEVVIGMGASIGREAAPKLAGALFTAEILLGSISLPVVLPAIVCAWIATAASWVYLPDRAITQVCPITASAGP